MHGKVLFILTIMEIVAFLILWSALSIKLSKISLMKIVTLVIILSIIAVITDYYDFKYAGIVNYIGCENSTNLRANKLMCGSMTSITSPVLITSTTMDMSFSIKVLVHTSSSYVTDNTVDLTQDSML
ncbi:hypothetical protein [Lutispora sp.]|uniref:hypothetical protein n=1 Tax=Lutispora sp. TaxID=2828727 RepID=UPI002B215025|nr:hypothetical protein [Lutispora sp.]MEA4962221.1 hypothetical protein [Lutispora sp.]